MLSSSTLAHARRFLAAQPVPVSAADLGQLEVRCGVSLPPVQRQLLSAGVYGAFSHWVEGPHETILDGLYGPADDQFDLAAAVAWSREQEDVSPLRAAEGIFMPRLPAELIPCAELVPGGDRLCVDAHGGVYHYRMECEPAPGYCGTLATAAHIKPIACGLDGFLAALTPHRTSVVQLHAIFKTDDVEALKAYLVAGHAPTETDSHGQTLLYLAAVPGAVGCIRLLCSLGARDPQALLAAAWSKRDGSTVRALLEGGELPERRHLAEAGRAKNAAAKAILKAALGLT